MACGGGSGSDNKNANIVNDLIDNDNTNNGSSGDGFKFYPYRTGKIVYQLESHNTFLEEILILDSVGTKTFIFKDWGNVRLEKIDREDTVTYVTPLPGVPNPEIKMKHELEKWIGAKAYDVDFEEEKITVRDLSFLHNLVKSNPEGVAESLFPITGDVIKKGTSSILGKPCDIYSSVQLGTTGCLHERNIPLNSTLNNPDIGTSTETAISIEFNIEIPESEFSLPNYPHLEH